MNSARRASLLMVAPFCHIPPMDGASQRATHLLEGLAKDFSIHLLAYHKQDAGNLQAWSNQRGISLSWLPEPPTPRQLNIIHRLASPLPPGFASHDARAIARSIQAVMGEHGPFEVIYFATQLTAQALFHALWRIPIVVDCYDVYTPIASRRIAEAPYYRPYHWIFRREASKTRNYEKAIFRRSRQIFTVSAEDQASVHSLYPQVMTTVIPNGVDLPSIQGTVERRQEVLMVANYSYAPNAEGFRWFYLQAWPRIRQRFPEARLMLAGKDSQALQALTNRDDGTTWLGFVPDLGNLYQQASCAIVPILAGGGTRLKTLEAMAWGTPLVSTRLGASGIQHEGTVAVAGDPESFAQAVIDRLENPAAFQEQAIRGRQIVAEKYAWEAICQKAQEEIKKIIVNGPGS